MSRPDSDRLDEMFEQQRAFMELLREKRGFPDFPVDITTKSGQKLCKDIAHDAMDELHEALQHLKNSKAHRATEVRDFDREKYLEELADHYHFFLELCIVSGVSAAELHRAFIAKGNVNVTRIAQGY